MPHLLRQSRLLLGLLMALHLVPVHAETAVFSNTHDGNGTLMGTWPRFSITGSDHGEPDHGEAFTTYQTLITVDTVVTAVWSYDTTESGTEGSTYDPAGWFVETAYGRAITQITDDALTTQSGSQTIPLHAGEWFGWYVHSLDQDAGAATLTVDMTLVEEVPEPASAATVLAGVLVLAVLQRRRAAEKDRMPRPR